MRKAVSFFLFVFGSFAGFAQIRLRRPIIEAPPLPTGHSNLWYVAVPVTLVAALVVYICLRIRKRVLLRRYSGKSSSKRRHHRKRSSRSSGSGDSSTGSSGSSSGTVRSASGSSRSRSSSSRSGSSSSSKGSSSSRSRSSSSSQGKSSSSSQENSSGQRGSRWTAALDRQAAGILPGQPDVFYMPSPDATGKFEAVKQKFHTNDRSWQFVVLPDTPTEAVLRFAGNEEALRTAYINNLPEWLLICEVSSAPGAEGVGFTQQPGRAILREGAWRIEEKIHIRFNG